MKSATRMMLMGDRYGKSAQRGDNPREYGNRRGYENMPREPYGEMNGERYDARRMGREGRDGEYPPRGGEYYRGREDGPHGMEGPHGGRHEKWDDKEMMLSGSAWINPAQKGMGEQEYGRMDEHKAREWVQKMKNADDTSGEHFRPEVAEQLRAAHAPDCDKWEFYAAINMIYSDDVTVAKKFGVDKPEYYACRAKAWLEDKDAKSHKLMRYKECIVK